MGYQRMKIQDFNRVKELELIEKEGHPIEDTTFRLRLVHGDDSQTGSGLIVIDWTEIQSENDIALFDENGDLLSYSIEDFDTELCEATVAVYRPDWVHDGTVQVQVAYNLRR